MSNCIFCKIISGDASAEILYDGDDVLVIKDIKPGSTFHFLAIPKQHIPTVKDLTKEHEDLVVKLVSKGKQVLIEKGGDSNDARLGFRLPPFNSVSHLHLHIIFPESQLPFDKRWVFRPNSWWFATADQILEKIKIASCSCINTLLLN